MNTIKSHTVFFLLVLILFITEKSYAQVPNVQDCGGAIPICSDSYSEVNAYSGVGNIPDEINDGTSCLGSGEKNDVWYTFTVSQSGALCFTITPNDMSDDYDWAVYNLSNNDCSDIYNNAGLEESCDYEADPGLTGPNGLSGVQNEPCLNVTFGETFVINVSQFSPSTAGYNINFSQSSAAIFDDVPPALERIDSVVFCGDSVIQVFFTENILCDSLELADIDIYDPNGALLQGVYLQSDECDNGNDYTNNAFLTYNYKFTEEGQYEIKLSGYVYDLCGNVNVLNSSKMFNLFMEPLNLNSTFVSENCNSEDGTATVSAVNPFSPFTYVWSDTDAQTTKTATGLEAGTYVVTVHNSLMCFGSKTVTVGMIPTLYADVQNVDAGCFGESNGEIIVTPSNGTPPYTFSFPSLSITDSIASNLPKGTYQVFANSDEGCSFSASITITETPITQYQISNVTDPICKDSCAGTANVIATTGISPFSYNWPDGTTTFNNTTLCHGSHDITITNGVGCEVIATVSVAVQPTTTIIQINDSISPTCVGFCDGRAKVEIFTGPPPFTVLWDNNENTQSSFSLCAGEHSVTVTDDLGCKVYESVTIIDPAPVLPNISGINTICLTETARIISYPSSGNSGPYTFSWSYNNQTDDTAYFDPTSTTSYTLVVKDGNGCTGDTTFKINVHPPLASNSTSIDTICIGDSLIFKANPLGGNGNYQFNWIDGLGSSDSVKVAPIDDYTFVVTISDNCSTPPVTQSYRVVVGNYPYFVIYEPDTNKGCAPIKALFEIDTLLPGWDVVWNFGDGAQEISTSKTSSHNYEKPGCFDLGVSVTNLYHCEQSIIKHCEVEVFENPKADFSFEPNNPTNLTPTVEFTDESYLGDEVQWFISKDRASSDEIFLFHHFSDSGHYQITLAVETEHGCRDTITKSIYVDYESTMYIPTSFTPNGDGTNDTWGLYHEGITTEDDYELRIFNRWGNLIYSTNNLGDSWNGAIFNQGEIVQDGSYVYSLTYRDFDGTLRETHGVIILYK